MIHPLFIRSHEPHRIMTLRATQHRSTGLVCNMAAQRARHRRLCPQAFESAWMHSDGPVF